jgi:predicted AAA+ superfamily ATPase
MNALFEAQLIILTQFKQQKLYPRPQFDAITLDNYITGIVGSRGIGKTTTLLQKALSAGALEGKALYASADHLFFLDNSLLALVDQLYKETDIRLLCIDEIHKLDRWTQQLKNIADTYQDFRILFSGSSMIDLLHSQYDLSRRVTLHTLHGFSFREYLEFTLDRTYPILDLQTLKTAHLQYSQDLQLPEILKHFKTYLRTGYYPFFSRFSQEWEKFQTIEHVTQKTIYEDIAGFKSLKTPTLALLEKLYKYVLNSPPGELSAFKLANTLSKDFEGISECLSLLEQAGLVRFLWPKQSGKAALRNPTKIYPENTNLIYASHLVHLPDMVVGKVRETFALNQLQNAGIQAHYPKMGDFQIDDTVFEVGGKNKTATQIQNLQDAYVLADGLILGNKKTIPLYLLGFLS